MSDLLNRTMRMPDGAPNGWLVNAKTEHKFEHFYDVRGNLKQLKQCHCVDCLKKQHPGVVIGEPVQVHEEYPVEVLKEMGIVGIYAPAEEEENAEDPGVCSRDDEGVGSSTAE